MAMPGAYNLLNWTAPPGGYAVRATKAGGLAFWTDPDGALVTGGDPCLCATAEAMQDKWLFADAQGRPQKPQALANVQEIPSTDTVTTVRIVPEGDTYPPIDANTPPGTFACYRIGARCYRLLLVQNAMLADDGAGGEVFDFSRAKVEWMAPREESFDEVGDIVRPLRYPGGPDWLPSSLAALERDTEIAPSPGGISGTVAPAWNENPGGWTMKWAWDAVARKWYKVREENDSMFVRDYWTSHWEGRRRVADHHVLYWTTAEGVAPAERVMGELQRQSGLARRIFSSMPDIPHGTAIDLALVCKTYYWYKRLNDSRLVNRKDLRLIWGVMNGEKGYYNTKLCGFLAQIAPVPPKERSAA